MAGLICSSAIPLIIRVELCAPQLPPVSIIIGINETKSGTAANAASYLFVIICVIVALIISIKSHTIRLFACLKIPVLKYDSSFGAEDDGVVMGYAFCDNRP